MSESQITKKAIADGLKELMRRKSFDKITIADITKQCGLNRQTFYYHFQDKYELVSWIYYHDAVSVMVGDFPLESWDKRLLAMLEAIRRDASFYENSLNYSGQQELEQYLQRITSGLFRQMIISIPQDQEMHAKQVQFISDFFAYGIVGTILEWARNGAKEEPRELVERTKGLIYYTRIFLSAPPGDIPDEKIQSPRITPTSQNEHKS